MRLLAYLWAAPNSLLGLLLGAAGRLGGGRILLKDGVVEIDGRALRWLLARAPLAPAGVAAITLGHVVLGRSALCLDRCRAHELVHVRQYERWGPLFLPAYAASSLWQWLSRPRPLPRQSLRARGLRGCTAVRGSLRLRQR